MKNDRIKNIIKLNKFRLFEIFAVLITGLLKFVLMDWINLRAVYICSACIFWVIYIYVKYKNDHGILKYWGFQKNNFIPSFLFLLPFAVISIIGILIYGFIHKSVIMNWHIIPILILYSFWGLIQQFMTAGVISGNLMAIKKINFKKYQIIIITSLIFSLVHYPAPYLMVYTFFMELIFLSVYFKWKNLWSLGIYHGWINSFLLFYVMQRDLWSELFIWL